MRALKNAWLVVFLCSAGTMAQSGPAQSSAVKTSGFAVVETLAVDASDAPHKVIHVKMTIPATPGDFVLLYPEWIPGEHGPTGPLVETAGIRFSGGGQSLSWRRDPVNMFAYHVAVPAGVKQVDVAMDYLDPVEQGGFSAGSSTTDKMALLSWNWLLLYPKGLGSDEVGIQASLKIPEGWQFATSLPYAQSNEAPGGSTINFALASLTTAVDSPVMMGQYLKKVPLQAGQSPAHELDVVSDSAAALQMKPQQVQAFDNLVAEAGALYGARHYRQYHFLLTLSNHVAHFGLEHHESDDSRVGENYMTDATAWTLEASLLPHEYTHSWNGKYRRPAGLATPDYDKPMDGNLLWVYEGLTEYFGYVLTARSGLQTAEQWRDNYALVAMTYSTRPGRRWRSLEDTAIAAQTLYAAPMAFSSYRRSVDYYDEGALIWLEVDTIIRQKSNGAKSMDDFAHLFHGGENTPPMVKTYTFDDVVATLNQVQPFDWKGFLTDRILKVAPEAPLQGLANSGWKLEYNEQPNSIQKMREQEGGQDLTSSIGLVIGKDGVVADSITDGVAFRGGVVPGMKLVAVNGRRYSAELLLEAIRHAKQAHEPIQLIVENTDYFHTVSLAYFDGLRYPHLVRDESKPDLLGAITAPKVTKLPAPFTGE